MDAFAKGRGQLRPRLRMVRPPGAQPGQIPSQHDYHERRMEHDPQRNGGAAGGGRPLYAVDGKVREEILPASLPDTELYYLPDDPHQQRNLFHERGEVAEDIHRRYIKFLEAVECAGGRLGASPAL